MLEGSGRAVGGKTDGRSSSILCATVALGIGEGNGVGPGAAEQPASPTSKMQAANGASRFSGKGAAFNRLALDDPHRHDLAFGGYVAICDNLTTQSDLAALYLHDLGP